MNERYQAENLNSKKLLEKEPDLVRPNLCKKPVFAMIIAHLCSNNCFFILFNWLPALVIKKIKSYDFDDILEFAIARAKRETSLSQFSAPYSVERNERSGKAVRKFRPKRHLC